LRSVIAQRDIAKRLNGCELGVEKDADLTRLLREQLASAKNRDAQPATQALQHGDTLRARILPAVGKGLR
jgi:hypothetical protein